MADAIGIRERGGAARFFFISRCGLVLEGSQQCSHCPHKTDSCKRKCDDVLMETTLVAQKGWKLYLMADKEV